MRPPLFFVAFILVLFAGSASGMERLYPGAQPKVYVELGGVPSYPGETHTCAAATLGMVSDYWRRLGEELTDTASTAGYAAAFEKKRGDIFPSEMAAEARKQGLLVIQSKQKNDLLGYINAGFPVIVRLKSEAKRWRYGVAVGYDLEKEELILRSCENEREVLSLEDFLEGYRASGYWKLIASPASMVPPGTSLSQYLKAIHELQQSIEDDDIVQNAYETALLEWPRSLRVMLEVADFYYEKYQYEMAYELYEEILKLNPKEPSALTQLPETMYYLGEFQKALEFIDTMIKKDNRLFKEFDGTRKKILESIESGKIILPNGL